MTVTASETALDVHVDVRFTPAGHPLAVRYNGRIWAVMANGDSGPRRAVWSRNDPVSVLGAWRNAFGQQELDALFTGLASQFSDCTSYRFELLAYDVVGDMAFTAGLEHTSASVDGEPRSYVLRATQIYRHEDGAWKVAHRHGDTVTG